MSDNHDVKGLWNGTFRYSASAEIGETPFKVRFAVKDGALSGLVVEEHLTRGGQVKAEIEGVLEASSLHFTKRYVDDSNDYKRPVEYHGTIAADGQSISGTWTLPDDSGTFVMTRPE